jgi:hypothetical protein
MNRFIFLVLFLLLSWVNIFAQLNESDTLKFQARASVTGNYQQGNVNIFTIRTKADILYSPTKHLVLKSQNSSLYQAFSSTKVDNDIFSRNYFYYKPQNKVYAFGIAYISSNYRRKINTRLFAGAGATWQALNKKYHVIKLSANVVYETNTFKGNTFNYSKYNGNNKINVWRSTFFVGGWNYLFNNRLRLYYDAFYQPAFNDKNNYRTQFEIGADLPIWKGLSFSTLYTFTHENVTITNIKKEDKILSFGVTYLVRRK